MKWVAISGGWRKTNQKIENDIRSTVYEIIQLKTKASEGMGTADTIEKARKKGIPVKVFNYTIK